MSVETEEEDVGNDKQGRGGSTGEGLRSFRVVKETQGTCESRKEKMDSHLFAEERELGGEDLLLLGGSIGMDSLKQDVESVEDLLGF